MLGSRPDFSRRLSGSLRWGNWSANGPGGGLVGILGFPELMDGGSITAPNLAIWTEEGWVVENEGVPPDLEVEQTPAEVNAGHDPQLEKAIQVVMDELRKNPLPALKRPPYPVRVK